VSGAQVDTSAVKFKLRIHKYIQVKTVVLMLLNKDIFITKFKEEFNEKE
jgi:hypothetical protein